MVKIIEKPQLRYTKGFEGEENIAVTTLLVEFENLQPSQPAMNLKVVGWRNMAEEINSKYGKGDCAIVQGRLQMNTIERNGIKEKKAELIVSNIYPLADFEINFQPRKFQDSLSNTNQVEARESQDSFNNTNQVEARESEDFLNNTNQVEARESQDFLNNTNQVREFKDDYLNESYLKEKPVTPNKEKPIKLPEKNPLTPEELDNLPF